MNGLFGLSSLTVYRFLIVVFFCGFSQVLSLNTVADEDIVIGQWRISHDLSSDAWELRATGGKVHGDPSRFFGYAYFVVKCWPSDNRVYVALPYAPTEPDLSEVVDAYVWPDNKRPTKIPMLRAGSTLLRALDVPGANLSKLFLAGLLSAKDRFSIRVGHKTLEFEASRLNEAWRVFSGKCPIALKPSESVRVSIRPASHA